MTKRVTVVIRSMKAARVCIDGKVLGPTMPLGEALGTQYRLNNDPFALSAFLATQDDPK